MTRETAKVTEMARGDATRTQGVRFRNSAMSASWVIVIMPSRVASSDVVPECGDLPIGAPAAGSNAGSNAGEDRMWKNLKATALVTALLAGTAAMAYAQ